MEYDYSANFNSALLEEVKKKLEAKLTNQSFSNFIKDLKFQELEGDAIVLETPKSSNVPVIEKKYADMLKEAIVEITKYNFDLKIVNTEKDSAPKAKQHDADTNKLNPKYNFDEFVSGKNNDLALNAAISIAQMDNLNPNENVKNPFFIYGGVGLGKTHLIQAIGNSIRNRNPRSNVIYVTSEKFLNEFVMAIKNNTRHVFQQKYRSCDVLLIDDIQFLKDKEETQEELFNTFNELHEKGKNIVFTSDRKPNDLNGIVDRLKSRFNWGLMVDISPPNYETRLAIIKKKLDKSAIAMPQEIIEYIASSIKTNVRDIEGCLNSIIYECTLTNVGPTMELAEKAVKRTSSDKQQKKVGVKEIKAVVADHYRIALEEIDQKKKTKDIANARQVAMYLTRTLTELSLPKIGDEFGGRDHSTVSSAIKKIEKLSRTDDSIKRDIQDIIDTLTKN